MSPRQADRVIMLGPAAPVRGGMAAVVDSLAASALAQDFDLVVLNTGKLTAPDRPWHVAIGSQLRLVARFAAMLLRGHGRVVHIHTCSGLTFWRDTVFLVVARLFRRKIVWHIHGGGFAEFIESTRGIRRKLLRQAFSCSHAVVVLSESWRLRLGRYLDPPRWAVIENGVSLPPPRASGAQTDTFLFVGTLDNVKGAEDLVAATAIASRHGFEGCVQLAGPETSPGQRERLRRVIDREGLADRVALLGMLVGRAKTEALETASAFVLPSHVEGLPMAMLEAMAYGLPVIVTEVGAIPEVVTDGVEGFLVRPGDLEALAERLTRLASDSALRDKMGEAARRRVADRYTVDAMAARIAALYRVLSSRHPGGPSR